MHQTEQQIERGLRLHRGGDVKGAAAIYRQVLVREPYHPEALYLSGCVAHQAGNSREAVKLLEKAIAARSDRAEFHYALGAAQARLDNLDSAESSLRRAIELGGRAEFHSALVLLLRRQRRQDEAQAHLGRALEALTGNAEGLCDLADDLQRADDLEGAIQAYHRALAQDSNSQRAMYACGCAEIARENFASAILLFEQALKLRPEWLEARHNLARALYEMGQVSPAYEEFKVCAACGHEGASLAQAMLAVIAPGVPQAGNQDVLALRQAWARTLPASSLPERAAPVIEPASQKLRIGYVSSFFHRDNWMKPVWGLINQHDRDAFDIFLFSDAPRQQIQHGYHASPADQFFDTSNLTNRSLAEIIRENRIDILVDLNGYSDMKRLPMYMLRPAPVTIGWFNMYATTGMPCFDILIGDHDVIPPVEEDFYPESICRVAHSYLTFSVDYPVPPVSELPCLSNSSFTFGCLGSQYKITTEVVEVWSRILLACPGRLLLLKNNHLQTDAAREFLLKLFSRFGVARERLQLEGPENHFDFLKAYGRVDVALDTFPYNGGTTTTEAIWQGVPVIAFAGDRWASRTSASILRAGGLGEFVAADVEGYVSLACRLANSINQRLRLALLRTGMRSQLLASDVCNTRAFAREMEAIYRQCRQSRQPKIARHSLQL